MNIPELSTRPVPPEDWECCNSDCGDACVWQIYYREQAAYEARQAQPATSSPTNEINL
ncbi:oxidoreductase-like domain-containing protein [Snodgrassella alvi]|uniref:oxidoreductase-like domain-containing protein n=1 Tax=Snodgrassella alvi TaxID=1196083 RepID=UPI000C1F09B6|nr:oxidoreductase-like domain-containing protein [Snodgrassella alvi]